jgi:hypothetical protein
MSEAVRTSGTSVDNYFTRQYIPEDNSEHGFIWLGLRASAGVLCALQWTFWFYKGRVIFRKPTN